MTELKINMRELKINSKIFHFVPYNEWGKNWDCTYNLTIEGASKILENSNIHKEPEFDKIKYYSIDGFKGFVSLEPASNDNGFFDLKEQLEAAKLGCNIIYEYIK